MEHHLAADPERSDIVHDLLTFLAEQMLEMNKTKGDEIGGFHRWLEGEIEVEIKTLQNKTKIQSYFDLSLDVLLRILKKNQRFIQVDPSSRNFQESLEREFTSSLAKLNPLLARIRQTDALIDQVVYQPLRLDRGGDCSCSRQLVENTDETELSLETLVSTPLTVRDYRLEYVDPIGA